MRSIVFAGLLALSVPGVCLAQQSIRAWPDRLVAAANSQIGVTLRYDPAYETLAFPGGDVPREKGVCTDVVVRAYRDAFGVDLQALVNADMKTAFGVYPRTWGLTRPDTNIDHRRVGNLRTYFTRKGQSLPVTKAGRDYNPGDIVTQMLPGNLPHIVLVSDKTGASGVPMVIHNIGAGARLEDTLFAYPITGHYRYRPPHI
ncbi:MAG: DUF1287 domain-containing protein [Proteobacteria bacterium]|nr:DUF1287 domain-containing protein [Pseudomonadota bacterium]